jgi:hypothetical protein
LRLSGAVGLAGLFGVAGIQPAQASSVALAAKIRLMILYAEALDICNIGYDQGQRWTFLDKKKRQIVPNKECDCSSSCGGIAWLAGYDVDIEHTFNSGNFAAKMEDAGFKKIAFGKRPGDKTDKQKLSQVQAGDFLVGPGHVIFDAGSNGWWSAIATEKGTKAGGAAGDSGKECVFVKPYMRDEGWAHILRPT